VRETVGWKRKRERVRRHNFSTKYELCEGVHQKNDFQWRRISFWMCIYLYVCICWERERRKNILSKLFYLEKIIFSFFFCSWWWWQRREWSGWSRQWWLRCRIRLGQRRKWDQWKGGHHHADPGSPWAWIQWVPNYIFN
jgi:hypothetical protein